MIGETVVYVDYHLRQRPATVLAENSPGGSLDLAVMIDNGLAVDLVPQRYVPKAYAHPEIYRQGHTWHPVDPGPVPHE